MELDVQRGPERRRVQVDPAGEVLRVQLDDGEQHEVRVIACDRHSLLLEVDGRRHHVRWAVDRAELLLQLDGHALRFHALDEEEAEADDHGNASPVVRAPMPGKVLEILVAEGDEVEVGQPVVRVEAMKMEVDLPAAVAGTVTTVHVTAGQIADPEQPLVTLSPRESVD